MIFYLLPSADPALLRAGRQPNPQLVEQIRHALGLDRPWYDQYVHYMARPFLHWDFGYSFQNNISVNAADLRPLAGHRLADDRRRGGVARDRHRRRHALRGEEPQRVRPDGHDRRAGRHPRRRSTGSGSSPCLLFANDIGRFKLLPGSGSYVPLTQDPGKWFGSLIMPWFVLAASYTAFYARLLPSNLIEVMGEDYIRTARAKGLTEQRVVTRHGIRSAITPIVTAAGLDIGLLLGGAILIEAVFNIPGIGRLAFESIQNSDLPMIQGTVLLGAFFIVVMNLVVDVAYAFLDPRVRYG